MTWKIDENEEESIGEMYNDKRSRIITAMIAKKRGPSSADLKIIF